MLPRTLRLIESIPTGLIDLERFEEGIIKILRTKTKKRQKIVVDISPMILALALANLSSTWSASEGDRR